MAIDPTRKGRLGPGQQALLDLVVQLRNRTHTSEDVLSGAGQRLQAPDTANLAQVTTALEPGARYLISYDDGALGAGNACFVRFQSAAVAASVANTDLLMYHGEHRYMRIPLAGNNAISALFQDLVSFVTIIRSDERAED